MPSNYPTLKDISAEAGVSMALVSVVLNGKKSRIKASPATRERILRAAEKFGYEPDRNARALRMSRSFLIGVLAYDISSSFVPKILAGIENGFLHTDYSVLPISYRDGDELARCLETFRRRKIDGLIIISTGFQNFPEGLSMWNRIAKVFIGCSPSLDCTSSVHTDSFAVGALAAEAFLRRGCRKFMYLTYANSRNITGWGHTLAAAGVPEGNCLTVKTVFDFDKSMRKVTDVLQAHPDIDCIFADSDWIAAAALKAADKIGRRIPEDLQLIGVDDSPVCLITSPPLSSIWQPKVEQGEIAAKLMLRMLDENQMENLVLPVRLTVRESLKPLEE